MAGAREFPEDKFAPSSFRRMGDPSAGMFDTSSPGGVPLGQAAMFIGAHGIQRAMDFVQRVKNGEIDPNSDEGLRQTLDLALLTLGRAGGVSRPGMGRPRGMEGEILAAEPQATPQLGFREPTILDQRAMPSSPMGRGVSGEPIRGGSAEGLPRLTREDPLTRYGLAGEQGQRIGPNRPPGALRPEIDATYSPTGQIESLPNVTTQNRRVRLGDESPLQADRLGAEQAAARARQAHNEFLDELRAADEGMPERGYRSPVAPPDIPPSRPMSAPDVTGVPRSPFLDMPAPGVRGRPPAPAPEPLQLGSSGSASGTLVDPLTGQAYRPRQMPSLSQAGSGSLSPVTRAEAVLPRRPVNPEELLKREPVAAEAKGALSAEEIELIRRNYPELAAELEAVLAQKAQPAAATVADFEVGPWGARPKTSRALPPGSTVLPPEPIAPAAPASAPPILAREAPIGSILGYGGLGTGATLMAALSGGPSAPQRRPMPAADADSVTAGYDTGGPDVFQQAAAERARNMYAIDDLDRASDARMRASQRMRDIDDADRRRDVQSPASRATSTARTVLSGTPAGASSPAAAPASRGFLSGLIGSGGKLFDSDYQKGMTSQQLYQAANRDPENQGAYWRAVQRQKEEMASGNAPQPEKRGGEVEQKPTKEAMLHKSLEIIHHMIRNR